MCSEKVKTEDVTELIDITGLLYQQQDAVEWLDEGRGTFEWLTQEGGACDIDVH